MKQRLNIFIYNVQICHFMLQLERKPRPFPTLEILRNIDNIDDFKAEDFKVIGYQPHPKIPMEMAV